jgi:hypothetical protein
MKIKVELEPSSVMPPAFVGSTLRGAFGVALKKITCINPSRECEGCFTQNSCLYYDFYEEKNRAHQYRFDINLNPKSYDFTLYLYEEATEKLPIVVSAIHHMLTIKGLGANRDKFKIKGMYCNDVVIYKDEKFDLSKAKPIDFDIDKFDEKCDVLFQTPMRMKVQGKYISSKPNLQTLLYSILARVNEIKDLPRIKLPFSPSYKVTQSNIYFKDYGRYSNRQKSKMKLGGVLGNIRYVDLDEKSFKLLKLGEIIGVGKQTVFGLGKIEVKKVI